jgi:hypothetical protein
MNRIKSRPHSFADRIAKEKQRLESELTKAEQGPARDTLLKKLRQLDVAAHADEWLSSPGLRSPS